MAVDTVTTGNTYTADPNIDTNNQDNTLVVGAIDACRLVAMPALDATTSVVIHIIVKDAPNAVFLDARLNLRDTAGALISTTLADITAANGTPFTDASQDDPGGTLFQPVGFINLPVDPATVGTLGGTSTGGTHTTPTTANSDPDGGALNSASAFSSTTWSGTRTFHLAVDHPHVGTDRQRHPVHRCKPAGLRRRHHFSAGRIHQPPGRSRHRRHPRWYHNRRQPRVSHDRQQ